MALAVDILKQNGVKNAEAIVAASNTSGLPLGVAVGMIMKESGGANIYGHDAGGAMHGAGEVTEANFKSGFLPVVLRGGTSNGVGPAQITYPGYFKQNPNYAWWDPYWSCLFGFNLLKGYLGGNYSFESLARAGSTYNSGNPTGTYNTYGKTFANLAISWTEKLRGASTDVSYNAQEDDLPSVDEIARAVWAHQIEIAGSKAKNKGKKVSAGTIMAWLDDQFAWLPETVWSHPVLRAGLPDSDSRAGKPVAVGTIMAYMDAFVADTKNTVVEAVRGITNDERVVKAVQEAIDDFVKYKAAEPGTIPAVAVSDEYVVVAVGDTLKAIAEANGKTVQEVIGLNPGIEPNALTVGQRIKVK